jgi:ubiquitin-conjugating enzyme E2 Z
VCLSILGTWRGEKGEQWSSAQGLESVLLSIQSLMSPNPYENEPGFEGVKKERPEAIAYIAKIRHESLRISVIQRMEKLLLPQPSTSDKIVKKMRLEETTDTQSTDDFKCRQKVTLTAEPSVYEYDAEAAFNALETHNWDPFADLEKRRFLWYYDSYLKCIETHAGDQADMTKFEMTDFESPGNEMGGHFNYTGLRTRLEAIMDALDQELLTWEKDGRKQAAYGTQLPTQLQFVFEQLKPKWNDAHTSGPRLEIALSDPRNPFIWNLTLYGEPLTDLDGGVFNITLHIPPTFPEVQPRVIFQTKIFHHRVSTRGALCYFPAKADEIESHLKAIVVAIADSNQQYDPRASVNAEAFDLYWGGEAKRKIYNRKMRRSAQASTEDV